MNINMEKLYYQKDRQQLILHEQLNLGSYALGDESSTTVANVLQISNRRKRKMDKQQPVDLDSNQKDLNMKDTDAFTTANVLTRLKKDQIVKAFAQKMKRNIVRTIDEEQSQTLILHMPNFEKTQSITQQQQTIFQNNILNNAYFIVKSLLILCLFLLTTIYISFEDANILYDQVTGIKGFIVFLILIQLGSRGIEIYKDKSQQKLKLIKKQLQRQTKTLLMLLVMALSVVLRRQAILQIILILMCFFQLTNLLNKLKIIENYILNDSGFEKYWDLCKILLINFFIAHCLSIILNGMAQIQVQGANWYDLKSLNGQPWFQKYIWGYYWGTTIMLTVGFGDLSANNYVQALCLIFIETISCIILAYNISQVSKIIQNMRELDNEKNHKLKIFHTIAKKYQIPEQLSDNVKNHIQQSIQMKKDYNIAQQQKIIEQLPQKLQNQLKKEINKSIFNGVFFLGDLTLKCQQKLAEKIHKIVTHPDQLILRKGQPWKVLILRTGVVGLTYRRDKSLLNGMIMDTTKIMSQQDKKLISTSFIWGGHAQGDLKSLTVSVLATIQKQMLQELLKKHNEYMFEYYCCEKDRFQNRMQTRTQKCQVCQQGNHSKVNCPSMHYCPLEQILVSKYLKSLGKQGLRMDKQNRIQGYQRRKKVSDNYFPLKNYQAAISTQTTILDNLPINQISSNNIGSRKSTNGGRKSDVGSRKSVFGQQPLMQRKSGNSLDAAFNYLELYRKVDKFQYSLDQILNLMKLQQEQSQQLETDKPWNYKSYFIKYNPQNLCTIYAGAKQQKINKIWNKQKSRRMKSNIESRAQQ